MTAAADQGEIRLSVASYNIHRCVGRDGRYDPDRVVQVIRELDADIIALQEVESRFGEVAHAHQSDYLAVATGFTGIVGPTILRPDAHYGNLLLSRWWPQAVRHIDLSFPGDQEPRGALDVDLSIGGVALRVVATHLGLYGRERRWQARRLLAALSAPPAAVAMLLGDINEWWPFARSLRRLRRYFGRSPAPRTFPACLPVLALDRIWARPRTALLEVRAHSTPLARLASDHLPLRATIRVDDGAG